VPKTFEFERFMEIVLKISSDKRRAGT